MTDASLHATLRFLADDVRDYLESDAARAAASARLSCTLKVF